jgi:hypothetical protein
MDLDKGAPYQKSSLKVRDPWQVMMFEVLELGQRSSLPKNVAGRGCGKKPSLEVLELGQGSPLPKNVAGKERRKKPASRSWNLDKGAPCQRTPSIGELYKGAPCQRTCWLVARDKAGNLEDEVNQRTRKMVGDTPVGPWPTPQILLTATIPSARYNCSRHQHCRLCQSVGKLIDGDGVCYMFVWVVRMIEVEEGDGSELENELRMF